MARRRNRPKEAGDRVQVLQSLFDEMKPPPVDMVTPAALLLIAGAIVDALPAEQQAAAARAIAARLDGLERTLQSRGAADGLAVLASVREAWQRAAGAACGTQAPADGPSAKPQQVADHCSRGGHLSTSASATG